MRGVSFCCIHGHQHKVQKASDAYYNALADQEALLGRMNGENIQQQEKDHPSGISTLSAEERIISNQQECHITSPNQISFHYENLKIKTCARRHPKKLFIYNACKSARSR